MKKIIHVDCSSGVSGDMLLGAFFDLGLSFDDWKKEMDGLGLEERPAYERPELLKSGVRGTGFRVVERGQRQITRRPADMDCILKNSSLNENVRARAMKIMHRLAECEAAIHGKNIEDVHFHELSGLDTIVDVVGTLIALRLLGIEKVTASPVNVGSGTVETEHGTLTVPAPATARLLEGAPLYSRFEGELTTPTGALLLTELASDYGAMPLMNLERVGHGAGERDYPHANVLRIFLGTPHGAPALRETETVYRLSANIDDMEPRVAGYVMDHLLALGALDVYMIPVYMKKNRPGFELNVICGEERLAETVDAIMKETSTLGVRVRAVTRFAMERRMETIDTPHGKISVKIGEWHGEIESVNPEYEDCARIARETGKPLMRILEDARAAATRKFRK